MLPSFFFSVFGMTQNRHLTMLKSKFPYGLLTDDFGILTNDDLAINDCLATPTPVAVRSHAYSYWQCFESKKISFSCDSSGIPDKYEGVMGLVVAGITTDPIRHNYIESRLWPIKDCKRFVKDAAKILKGTRYACISGSVIGNEFTSIPEKETMSWTFERIKTKKGCEGRNCDFTKEFKRNNCSHLKL